MIRNANIGAPVEEPEIEVIPLSEPVPTAIPDAAPQEIPAPAPVEPDRVPAKT